MHTEYVTTFCKYMLSYVTLSCASEWWHRQTELDLDPEFHALFIYLSGGSMSRTFRSNKDNTFNSFIDFSLLIQKLWNWLDITFNSTSIFVNLLATPRRIFQPRISDYVYLLFTIVARIIISCITTSHVWIPYFQYGLHYSFKRFHFYYIQTRINGWWRGT